MSQKERWASRLGLVLAMAGNAVGLGNFLRFPAQAARNGGGDFMIPYILAFLFLGLPLVWVEWTMGRFGGKYGHHSTPGVFDVMGRAPFWKYLGVFGLWVNLIIAAYYLYIESWTISYASFSLVGGFSRTEPSEFFAWLVGSQDKSIIAVSPVGLAVFFLCMGLNVFILSRGLAKGIEIVAKIGMPILIIFAAILALRGLMITPENDSHAQATALTGLNYLWNPEFQTMHKPTTWLAAAGQIFFTLSVGMGSMHCYASYLQEKNDITLTGTTAAWTNEFCEVILGGSMLVPITVAYMGVAGLDLVRQESGLGLGFVIFPKLFANWGALAPAAGFMWFGLLFFAAITSSLAMGQPIMAFLQTEFQMSRGKSALVFGAMLLPLALPVACFNLNTFFTDFDDWAGTFALVVFATIETILFAWVFGTTRGWQEMEKGAELKIPRVFFYVIQYVTPVLLLVILVGSLFEPAAGWNGYLQAISEGTPLPAWEWSKGSIVGKLLFYDLPFPDNGTADDIAYVSKLRWARGAARLLLVSTFSGFVALVYVAWARRRARGEHLPQETPT
jgi:SNF family Na+-dependent transporter